MKHILFIDPIDKLVPSKDSSILIALTLKEQGHDVFFLFEEDFYITNKSENSYKCFNFSGNIEENFYISDFSIDEEFQIKMDDSIIFHMRIDPPYDSRYQRYLWMQEFLISYGVKVVNNPIGIMKNNEKIEAYKREMSLSSFVGSSVSAALSFIENLKEEGIKNLIFKPLDLYQGIGVQKVSIESDVETILIKTLEEFNGPVVIQPFEESIVDGEIRSIFFKSVELGTILKIPKAGEFLANIAQGAKYERHDLSPELLKECEAVCEKLGQDGVDFIAFDILGGKISEVNVTCPGLLVEVSSAMEKNLAIEIANSFN